MLQLHFAPNTISIAVAIALNEGNVHYEPIQVDFPNAEQTKPAYHKINPKGRVPVLTTPQGRITETGAILDYLCATAVPELMPADAFQAARARELTHYLASTMHVNHAHKMRGHRWADKESSLEDMKAKVPETMAASAAYVETLIDGPFILGDTVTFADCYLFIVTRWLPGDGVDIDAYPRLRAHHDAMEKRHSVKRAYADGMLTT